MYTGVTVRMIYGQKATARMTFLFLFFIAGARLTALVFILIFFVALSVDKNKKLIDTEKDGRRKGS